MIISLENARLCYDEIVKKIKKRKGKIVIFVAFDFDSLTSLRVLVSILRTDCLRYEIIPVMNYSQLENKINELNKTSNAVNDVRAFIMINCSGNNDLTKFWFCDPECDIICLLIDVHRPVHHNNIHELKSIILIDDALYNIENCPRDEDLEELENDEDVEEEEEKCSQENGEDVEVEGENYLGDENIENEGKDKPEVADKACDKIENESERKSLDMKQEITIEDDKKKRKIKKKKEELEEIEDETEKLDEVDQIVSEVIQKKSSISAILDEKKIKKKIKMKKRMKIQNYYSGSYFGLPSTYIFYKIACQLHKEDTQNLWYLILAMTEHYLSYHCSSSIYDSLYEECQQAVLKVNQLKNPIYGAKKIKKEEVNDEDNRPLIEDKWADVKVKTANKEVKTILIESDYRLYLYRHWNLFDSFVYSTYTLGHLGTWKEPGRFEVQKLFAYIGVPLDEAKQKYTFMKNEHKSLFKDKIIEISKNFDLNDLIFHSFLYQLDQKTQLSASDFVYLTSSILDYPFSLSDIGLELLGAFMSDSDITSDIDPDGNVDQKAPHPTNKFENFWAAYSFLSLKESKMTKPLIELAIKFQQAIVHNGTAIIDKRAITPSKSLRYSIINSDLSEESHYFHHPLSLEKLGLFIMEIYNISKVKESKPFVIAMFNSSKDSYLVAGILGNARSYDEERNQFALKFKYCANKIGAGLVFNNFYDSIVEIKKDELISFLEELCLT